MNSIISKISTIKNIGLLSLLLLTSSFITDNEQPNLTYSAISIKHSDDGVVKTIDKRTETSADGSVYYLVFISKPTLLNGGENAGHAYVVWGVEDNTAQMSYAQAWGLYPSNSLSSLTLGIVPGEVRNDGLNTSGYNRLIVKIDKAIYDNSIQRMQIWAKQGNYQLLTHDCLSFTIEMAQIAQLNTPERSGFDNIPWNFLISLINAN